MKSRKTEPLPQQNPAQDSKPDKNEEPMEAVDRSRSAKLISTLLRGLQQKRKENCFIKIKIFVKQKNDKAKRGCQKLYSFISGRLNRSKYMAILNIKKAAIRNCFNRNLIRSLQRLQKRSKSSLQRQFFSITKNLNNLKTRGQGILKIEDKSQNKIARKPTQITILDEKPNKTIDERNKTRIKIQQEEVNRLLEEIDDSLKRQDERKLVACLKKIVTKYSKAQCLAKGFYIFKAFKELIGYKRYNERQVGDFEKLVDIMLSDSKHIDYYLKELRERKRMLEKQRKKDGNEEEDPIKIQKIEKDLKNLEQLFNLIIEHYEGGYEHKRRARKELKSRNQSMYSRTDGRTVMGQYSFAQKSISIKKSLTPGKANQLNLLSHAGHQPEKNYHLSQISYKIPQNHQYNVQNSYKFSPQGSELNIEEKANKKEQNSTEILEKEIIKYQNLYQENKRLLEEYKETMRSIEKLTLELKGFNYKINSQRNTDKDIEKLANMDLKEQIGIKDEIIKLYDCMKRQADKRVSAKDKQFEKLQSLYEKEKDKAQASHNRFIEENKKVKSLQSTEKQTKSEKMNEIAKLKEDNKILQIEKNKFERSYENSLAQMKALQEKLKNAAKHESDNRHLQLQINKLIKSKEQLQAIKEQQKFKNQQNKDMARKIQKKQAQNKKLQEQIQQMKAANKQDKQQIRKLEKQIRKYESMNQYLNSSKQAVQSNEQKRINRQMEELENKFQSMVQMHKDEQISQLSFKLAEIQQKGRIIEEKNNIFEKNRVSLIKQNETLRAELINRDKKQNQQQAVLQKRVLELESKIKPVEQKAEPETLKNINESKKVNPLINKTQKQTKTDVSRPQQKQKAKSKTAPKIQHIDQQNQINPQFQQNQTVSRLLQLQKKLLEMENKKKGDRIEDLQMRVSQLQKHIMILQKQSQRVKVSRINRRITTGGRQFERQSEIFSDKHSERNQIRKYPSLPTSQLILLKLQNANFQSLPQFVKSILSEYLKRIIELQYDLAASERENDLLFHKVQQMKNKLRKTVEENQKNTQNIADKFYRTSKQLEMEIQSVMSQLQENICPYCGNDQETFEAFLEENAKILTLNSQLEIQNQQVKCQLKKILKKYSELKAQMKKINSQFILNWKDDINDKEIQKRFYGHQSARGKKILQLTQKGQILKCEVERLNKILAQLAEFDASISKTLKRQIEQLKQKHKSHHNQENLINSTVPSKKIKTIRSAASLHENQPNLHKNERCYFTKNESENHKKWREELNKIKQANRQLQIKNKQLAKQIKKMEQLQRTQHDDSTITKQVFQEKNKHLQQKLVQKQELLAKLTLEKSQLEKRLRQFEWGQRMKEADQIESRIMGEKQAKMKRDWLSSQITQSNCPNCVDISHYYMLMETYMQKLIMYLISEKNLVLTYQYREYCHYQTENKMNKNNQAYVKKWYEFTQELIAKTLKKLYK